MFLLSNLASTSATFSTRHPAFLKDSSLLAEVKLQHLTKGNEGYCACSPIRANSTSLTRRACLPCRSIFDHDIAQTLPSAVCIRV